jgi:asparagine synthase (glutamine-hydrolysing)
MCGIAGFIGSPGGPDARRACLDGMLRALRHRGPDDEGQLLGATGALGMRRLSIIDLAGGHQPILNEDGSLAVVLNGEIYNHRELRGELSACGHAFRTASDTEVILHLYEELGAGTPARLNGMFAFAVLDLRSGDLFLARDRFGEKPLYWFQRGMTFAFASELRSLAAHPDFPTELDREALALHLQHEFIPSPRAPFRGVRQLEPGTALLLRGGEAAVRRYWSIAESCRGAEPFRSVEELDAALAEAVRSRMVSDVPVGAFLSGGLDSSLVLAGMRDLAREPVRAFCIGFEDPSFDESAHARAVAEGLGVELVCETLTEARMLELLPSILADMDGPVADASFVPTHLVSALAARSRKVVLSGDGGDEVFGGYPTCQAHWWAERAPSFALRLAARAARALPSSERNFSLQFKLERFGLGAGLDWAARHFRWMGSLSRDEALAMVGLPEGALAEDPPLAWARALDHAEVLQKILFADQRFYMGENILAKVDRASMASSLEVRSPFLDHRLVERANATDWRWKLDGRRGKLPLRALAARRFPPSIARRPKKGFGIPVARWLRQGLRDQAEAVFAEANLRRQGLVEPAPARLLWSEHLSGRRDRRKPLWTLLVLHLWHERFSRLTREARHPADGSRG